MNLKLLGWLLLLLPLACACDSDDDIEGIFLNRTWHITEVFNSDGEPALPEQQRDEIRNNPDNYAISFAQENFMGKASSVQFQGNWTVDGGNQHIRMFNVQKEGSDPTGTFIVSILENADRYEGDYNQLRIYAKDNGPSILFKHSTK